MATIVVLGAGLGGMSAAYEIRAAIGRDHRVIVVGEGPRFSFTPSNPWVAVGWRTPADIEIEVAGPLGKQGIEYDGTGAERVEPAENRLRLRDGRSLAYDHLGSAPARASPSMKCPVSARKSGKAIPSVRRRMPLKPGRPISPSSATPARS
jgi:NADH dehydrogenase FAD-containing subunit